MGSHSNRLAAGVLYYSGLAALARRVFARHGAFVLELHGVASRRWSELPRGHRPSFCAADLETLLDWLAPRFRFFAPQQIFEEPSSAGVLLTFDDGFANLHDVALPILERRGVPAVFFVATQHVIDPQDWLPAVRRAASVLRRELATWPPGLGADLFDGLSEQKLAACGRSPWITLGAHSVSHPFLTRCNDGDLERELVDSKRYLEQISGSSVGLFAYPSGDYDRRVSEAARRAGYLAAFAEDRRSLVDLAFEIPRVGIYSVAPSYLASKLSGLHRRPLPPIRLANR